MKVLSLLIVCLLFISCNKEDTSFKLNEIKFSKQIEKLTEKDCSSLQKNAFLDLFDYLKDRNENSYNQIMLIYFSHSGDVTDLNTIVLFESNDGKKEAIRFDYPWKEKKTKTIGDFNFNTFKEDVSSSKDGSNTSIEAIWIDKNNIKCLVTDKFDFEKYQNLKDLSYFN